MTSTPPPYGSPPPGSEPGPGAQQPSPAGYGTPDSSGAQQGAGGPAFSYGPQQGFAPQGMQPASAPDHVRIASEQGAHPALAAPPRSNTGLVVAAAIGITIAGLALILALAYMLLAIGAASFVAAILALIPLSVVLLVVWWVDRWEPEPIAARIFALLWGAGVAVVVALIVGLGVDIVLHLSGGDSDSAGAQFFGAVIQAPLVEESAKGFGVLLIFLAARKLFDGPVDGIVYAATVAAGFAFTENIEYFGIDIAQSGGTQVIFTFFLRAILSPFAHVMFTSMTGLAIGFAARRWGGRGPGILAFFIGLIPAMMLHGLWNAAGYFTGSLVGYLAFYALVQVPLFAGLVIIVVYLRRQEAKTTRERLTEYAAAGWFNPDEVVSLATASGRSRARSWAARNGRKAVMRNYIRDATALANTRQRIVINRNRAAAQADEARLLQSISEERRALLA